MLQGALVHEWAHHLEFQCEEHNGLRPAFTTSLGMTAETPWRSSTLATEVSTSVWAEAPSEQWAEAVIVLVLHAVSYLPFISDDALISLRYAQRLLDGGGLTWNDGERRSETVYSDWTPAVVER